jgi:hypothetical protein
MRDQPAKQVTLKYPLNLDFSIAILSSVRILGGALTELMKEG